MSKIEDLNTRSAEIRSDLRAFLDHPEYPPDVKTRWLLASLDIALEHQEAILLLIRSKLFGSTFAMVRIIFDTMRRALLINECATEQQIEEAWRDELDWLRIPVRADMKRTCFSAATPARRDEFFSLLKEVWPAMCDDTHSGARQMTRRFTNGELKPNYTEDEIHEAINATNAALMLLSTQVFLKMGRVREAEEVCNCSSNTRLNSSERLKIILKHTARPVHEGGGSPLRMNPFPILLSRARGGDSESVAEFGLPPYACEGLLERGQGKRWHRS